jgi:ABC-type multidrug transport system fused ATPase/permease subunit
LIATGNFHLAALLVSSAILVGQCLFKYAVHGWKGPQRQSSFDFNSRPKSYTPISYVLSQMTFAATSFVVSVIAIHESGSWKRSLLLADLTVLCVIRVASKLDSFRHRIYRHVNALATTATLLSAVQVFLPITIIDTNYRPTTTEIALVGCLIITVIIPVISPRPHRPLKREQDGDDEQQVIDNEKASPEETCSLFSFFWSYEWLTYLILRGCSRDLTVDDLPLLPSYDAPLKWLHSIRKQRQRGGRTFRTLCRLLQRDIKTIVGWAICVSTVDYIAPTAMFHLLRYLGTPDDAIVHPLFWILLLFVGPVTRSLCYQQYIFTVTRLLVRVNMSLVQEIYQTALRSHLYDASIAQSKTDGKTSSDGTSKTRQADITTLMSYDVEAIYNSHDIFFAAVSVPISITIAITFMYRMLGWPSLIGVTALFLMTPLPTLVSRRISQMQRSVMHATDARLSKITEYLGSIRTLKYFGWEPAMSKKINSLRTVEQQRIWKRNVLSATISMTGDLLPMICLLITFSVVVLFTDTPLVAPVAFTSLSIMEILRSQCIWMSIVVRMASQGIESLRRLDRFFSSSVEIQRHPDGPPQFRNATFRRTPIAVFKLQNLSILFKPEELNVVTGPTGSGKTSLLLSLLGETVLESGAASCPKDVAYVPQTAWLQNDTIRQNILFYSSFEQKRYDAVVDACGLTQDLKELPAGDQTVVGERGASLSGGQKQRVSLARAIYSRASTLLLDDIFSALDTHTTTLVYDQCFRNGLLAGRTVILVTHLPAALLDARMVVTLDRGVVSSIRVAEPKLDSSEVIATVDLEEETPAGSLTSETPSDSESDLAKPMPEVTISSVAAEPESNQAGRMVEETSAKGRIPRTLGKLSNVLFLFNVPNLTSIQSSNICFCSAAIRML